MLASRNLFFFVAVMITSFIEMGSFAPPAHADLVCPENTSPVEGYCVVTAKEDGDPEGGEPGLPRICRATDGREVDCESMMGVWFNSKQCYAIALSNPPPLTDPVWGGHTDGVIMSCTNVMGGRKLFWAPSAPDVSVVALASQAVEEMHLVAPEIGLTGYGQLESMQVIGLPTWMWAADPGESTTGPITRSASAGAVTVTATARLRETVWSMGDGGVVTCLGENAAGTPYEGSYDKAPSPTCGYRYTQTSANQPGKAYTVMVTSNWEIGWSSAGRSGTMTRSYARTAQLRVGEVQVIVDGSGQGES